MHIHWHRFSVFFYSSSAFAMSLWDLQQHFLDNKNAHNALGKLIHCFQVGLSLECLFCYI